MYQYAIVHEHRHGTSVYGVKSIRKLTIKDAEKYLGDEFESDRDDEWIHLQELEFKEIQ